MSKPVKAMVTAELKERYAGVDSACVVDITGLDVKIQEKLRRTLREKSARLQIVKNSLAKHAFKDTPLAPLGDSMTGPCALITSSQSLIEIAKLLISASKEFGKLALKSALLDGDPALMTIAQLSKMRGKREVLGELAMLVGSPGRAIAGCLAGAQARVAGCLKTLADKPETASE